MERLTFEGNFCDIICCENTPGGSYCESDCSLKQIWERLKEYEDAGLSPAACAQARRIEDVLSERDSSIDIMVELMVAYEAGRIVVLPCKDWLDIVFGEQTQFWGIDTDYLENPIREISADNAERIGWYDGWKTVFLKGADENGQAWEFCPDSIGKTIFLTREEAEEALRRADDARTYLKKETAENP